MALRPGGVGGPGVIAPDALSGQSSNPRVAGVSGSNDNGGDGIFGRGQTGVHAESGTGDAVLGISQSNQHAGVSAINDSGGFGLWARGAPAGHFEGNIEATGQLQATSFHIGGFGGIIDGALTVQSFSCTGLLSNGKLICNGDLTCNGNVDCRGNINIASGGDILLADCAEEFEVSQKTLIEPGTVMVIDQEGMVEPSWQAYDKRVAGVISGAGNCKPAIVLNKQQSPGHRVPVALLGKAYCKVDARYGSIEVGDLLTTSPTVGHAMKACDPIKAFGAVIGKALQSLAAGQGAIPILIALQ
jgi:hypothetical protein